MIMLLWEKQTASYESSDKARRPKVTGTEELPEGMIRGMCRGITTDVPNDLEYAQVADKLVTAKTAARLVSLKCACKISLDVS